MPVSTPSNGITHISLTPPPSFELIAMQRVCSPSTPPPRSADSRGESGECDGKENEKRRCCISGIGEKGPTPPPRQMSGSYQVRCSGRWTSLSRRSGCFQYLVLQEFTQSVENNQEMMKPGSQTLNPVSSVFYTRSKILSLWINALCWNVFSRPYNTTHWKQSFGGFFSPAGRLSVQKMAHTWIFWSFWFILIHYLL